MSGVLMNVTEYAVGNKVSRQAHASKAAALAWAKARVLDADIATVAVWQYESELDFKAALGEAIAGRDWWETRALVCVVAAKAVRVSK